MTAARSVAHPDAHPAVQPGARSAAAAPPPLSQTPVRLGDSGLARLVTVSPGMCAGSRFFGQLGDWTWEAVSECTRTNVYAARTPEEYPAYLSFYFFDVRGNEQAHLHGLTFGDQLEVVSQSFDFGSESVLTLHRVRRLRDAAQFEPRTLDLVEFFERPRPDSLYVTNLNRWISRGGGEGNEGLQSCSPQGFQHAHLPHLPAVYSPRAEAALARRLGSFHPDGVPGYEPVAPPFTTEYELDVVHDLNGVGLVYFASYFTIVDTALLRLWRELGRGDRRFMSRRVVDQRIGYYGNADPDAVFTVTVRLLRAVGAPGAESADEIADVAVRDARTGRLLAVCAAHLLLEE